MNLSQVLTGVTLLRTSAPLPAVEVRGIAYDSRKVEPGFLFFAFSGAKTDGAQFAATALQKGAVAVVGDRPVPGGFSGLWLQVPHGREALALSARNFYNKPDEHLAITAITGTNGKTTSSTLIDAMLRAAGKTTALIGTIEYHLAGKVLPAVNTTPESLDLFAMCAELLKLGGTHMTFEASSHALDLGRIYAMNVHTAGFTNFTRDHLDYHHTMEAYFAAKQLLFKPRSGPPPRFAVLNADDEWVRKIELVPETQVFWYGLQQEPPAGNGSKTTWIRPANLEMSFNGLRFTVVAGERKFPIESQLVGHINVYNILLACGCAISLGLSDAQIQKGLHDMQRVPGRFERVEEGQPYMVVVDYAHTDDALRNVISVARAMNPKRIITLFGCGGDRDRAKRPLMGMAAAELSDYVVLTSDNPRSEDPLAILAEIAAGIPAGVRFEIEPERGRAIERAIAAAAPGDVVVIAGKGHETYQVVGERTLHFDDRDAARAALAERATSFARRVNA